MQQGAVHFISLGCPKNLVDSQVMLGLLERDSYRITQDPAEAEVIIVNTCSFIQAAKEESIETILEMADYKEQGKCQALVVSGCMAQRYHKELEKKIPEVDLIIGTGQYHRITELLALKQKENGTPTARSWVTQPAFIHSESDPRLLTGPKHTAYLKISEGCNRRCSFCIIPKLRGNVRSRTVESLVAEARNLAAQGAREINLVAQDLTEYGMEWKYKERLETLLPQLCAIDGIEWIRLHYVYPDQFSDELLEIIAREPKIVKYLDMPIQHTSDRVLRTMNRRLTKEKLFTLMDKLRAKIPGLAVRTSIIVGFPGETEDEFNELCSDLEQLDLDHVGIFAYSKEEDTSAGDMPDQIPPATRRKRKKVLIEQLQKLSLNRRSKKIGSRETILIEGVSQESDLLIQGRLSTQAQEIDGYVLLNDLGEFQDLKAGDFVEAELTELMPEGYIARVIHRAAVTA